MSDAVLVAIIVSVVGPSILVVLNARSNGSLAKKVGDPNGHGSLVEMVNEALGNGRRAVQLSEQVLTGQAEQDARLASIEARAGVTERHVDSLDRRLSDVEHAVRDQVTGDAT